MKVKKNEPFPHEITPGHATRSFCVALLHQRPGSSNSQESDTKPSLDETDVEKHLNRDAQEFTSGGSCSGNPLFCP